MLQAAERRARSATCQYPTSAVTQNSDREKNELVLETDRMKMQMKEEIDRARLDIYSKNSWRV